MEFRYFFYKVNRKGELEGRGDLRVRVFIFRLEDLE